MQSQQTSWQIRRKALWIFIQFPSGCCFVLLRPDAVPFGLLRHSSRLLGVFLKPLRVLFELLGSLLGASWSLLELLGAILGRLGAKLCGLGSTFGALDFFIIFWTDFGSKKGAQREAFWEPKRSKNR